MDKYQLRYDGLDDQQIVSFWLMLSFEFKYIVMESPISTHLHRIEHHHQNLVIANRKVLADFRTLLRRGEEPQVPAHPHYHSKQKYLSTCVETNEDTEERRAVRKDTEQDSSLAAILEEPKHSTNRQENKEFGFNRLRSSHRDFFVTATRSNVSAHFHPDCTEFKMND